MALTKEQWYQKLKAWVPSWFFDSPYYQVAIFYAIANVIAASEASRDDNVNQTFLTQATGSYLDLHGSERQVDRLTDEQDSKYSPRIRYFKNQSNSANIQNLVNSLLINGTCLNVEDAEGQLFCNRGIYANRGQLLVKYQYNAFTIVVPNQKHAPYSFCSRGYYVGRGNFIGTNVSPPGIFQSIIAAVDKAKAFGVLYRLFERTGA